MDLDKIDFENNAMYSRRKILLILGPQSSGKSTLISAILNKLPISRTINRKKIISKVNEKANRDYLRSILLKIKEITGKEINNLNQLHLINEDEIEFSKKKMFAECKEDLLKTISSEEFNNYLLANIFQSYALESSSFLSSGFSVIIDETEINSDINYEKFSVYFKNICIKKALIFNTLELLLQKNIERNNSFLSLLESQENIEEFLILLDSQEKESGNSRFTYRPISGILDNYKKYFVFSASQPNSKKTVLQVLYRSEMSKTLVKIIECDQEFQKKLKKWDFFRRRFSSAPLQIEKLMESIFGDSEKVNIESKINFDYIIESKFDPFFTNECQVDQLPNNLVSWLREEIVDH